MLAIGIDDNPIVPVAVALANEGVPIRAIARATKIPSAELYDLLKEARAQGFILDLPIADWPHPPRNISVPGSDRLNNFTEEELLHTTMTAFGLTACMARIMLTLIRLPGAISYERLHDAYNSRQSGVTETAPKIIDVQICKMRKRLKKFGLEIVTEWGYGKQMPKEDRLRALKMLITALSPA